jgi:hypothetical protein
VIDSDFASAVRSDRELMESSHYGHHLEGWLRIGDAVLVLFNEELLDNPQRYLDRICEFIGIPRFDYTENVGVNERVHSESNWEIPRSNRLARNVPKISYVFYRARLDATLHFAKISACARCYWAAVENSSLWTINCNANFANTTGARLRRSKVF